MLKTGPRVRERPSGLLVPMYREKTSAIVIEVPNVFIIQREHVILLNGEEKKAEI